MTVTREYIVIDSINELREAAIECDKHKDCECCAHYFKCSVMGRIWSLLDLEAFTPVYLRYFVIKAMGV